MTPQSFNRAALTAARGGLRCTAVSRRSLIFVNGVVRLGWGLGALLEPSAMATARFVPDTETRPDARLFVRGFGAHQVGAAVLALGALSRPRLERPAMVLAVALDVVDMVSAVVEARARGRLDADTAGGFVFSATGAASAAAALRAPR
jgi:hypothetical protein